MINPPTLRSLHELATAARNQRGCTGHCGCTDCDLLAEIVIMLGQEKSTLRLAAQDLERRAGKIRHLPGAGHTRRAHHEIAAWLRARARGDDQ